MHTCRYSNNNSHIPSSGGGRKIIIYKIYIFLQIKKRYHTHWLISFCWIHYDIVIRIINLGAWLRDIGSSSSFQHVGYDQPVCLCYTLVSSQTRSWLEYENWIFLITNTMFDTHEPSCFRWFDSWYIFKNGYNARYQWYCTPRLSAGWASMCGMYTLRTHARTYIHADTKTNYCQIYLM